MSFKYFNNKDFQGTWCVPKCDISDIDKDFLTRLDKAREFSGERAKQDENTVVYGILSAFRTVEHELKNGRDGNSPHTRRVAVDIRALNSRDFFYITYGLMLAGFTRIGLNYKRKFIHVDEDVTKPVSVMFPYNTTEKE